MNLLERLSGNGWGEKKDDDSENPSEAKAMGIDIQNTNQAGNKNILVVLQGNGLDEDLVVLSCNLAKQSKSTVFAMYPIEVPRTLPVDAELPDIAPKAKSILDKASVIANRLEFNLEPEVIQSRSSGGSIVDEANSRSCALILLGLPFQTGRTGKFELGEMVSYVLANAKSRVWLVRGQQS